MSDHYRLNNGETKDVLRELVLRWESGNIDTVSICYLWNACKYLFRLGRKDSVVKELTKARDYIDFALSELEKDAEFD